MEEPCDILSEVMSAVREKAHMMIVDTIKDDRNAEEQYHEIEMVCRNAEAIIGEAVNAVRVCIEFSEKGFESD